MKTVVINLKSRTDRLTAFSNAHPNLDYEVFSAVDGRRVDYDKLQSLGFDVNHDWIDPLLNTPLTKGEVGCFLSHWEIWKKCVEMNEPVMVLEDDARITDRFSMEEIEQYLQTYSFLYLGWKEMKTSVPIDGVVVEPVYPYWTLAYVITPESAKILMNESIATSIIPVDEYLPTMMDKLNVAGYEQNVFEPVRRNEFGSDVLSNSRYDNFIDFKLYAVTVATEESKAYKLFNSAKHQSAEIINIGKGIEWGGGVMEKGHGGGQKINLVREFIADKKDSDVLLFLDGYDTFLSDSLEEISYRYTEFSERAIFSSERFCWPDERLSQELKKRNENQKTPYQYLNSGTYIARIGDLKKLFSAPIKDNSDDQLYVQLQYLTGEHDIALDVEGYIFLCHEPKAYQNRGQLYNPITGCYTCVYHGNGGESAKNKLASIYNDFYGLTYIPTKKYDILSDDILLIDFMTEDMCKNMISLSEKKTFESLSYDKVKGQELRLKEIELWDELEKHWMKSVYDIVYEYWNPCHIYGLRDAFLIKYEMNKQRELRLHNDASLITGSVKLNDDYTGGELYFPRQKFSNKDIPIGKCILFPGQVTHGHTSQEITSGTKYSLTIWSSRYEGDVN